MRIPLRVQASIYRMMDEQRIHDSLSKRDIVIETIHEQSPMLVKMEAVNDTIKQLDGLKVGDIVDIDFDIKGREWKKDDGSIFYFTALTINTINKAEDAEEYYS